MKKIVRLVAINTIVVILILLVLEGITRLFSSTIRTQGTDKLLVESNIYRDSNGLRKLHKGEAFDREVNTDEYRFRKNKTQFNDSLKTTLLIGDSVTMGVGIEDGDIFCSLLQDQLKSVNVANPSVIGYDTHDYKNVVAELSEDKKLNINRIIIFFCLNDVYLRASNNSAPMLSKKPFIGSLFEFLKTNSYFYIWLKGTFFDRSKVFFENDYNLYTEKNMEGILENFKTIAKDCEQNQIQFNVVLLPYEYQLRNHNEDDIYKPQEILKSALEKIKIKTHDISTYFKKNIDHSEDGFLFADGIHFSEKGHKIVADYVLKEVL